MKASKSKLLLGDYPPRHKHTCSRCGKTVYCSDPNCPHPEKTECYECSKGYEIMNFEGELMYGKRVAEDQDFAMDRMLPYRER